MKLDRLLHLRALLERAAERDLRSAQLEEALAARRVRALEAYSAAQREDMARALAVGDTDEAYLDHLGEELAEAAIPGAREREREKEAARRAREALYFAARSDRAALEELRQQERERRRRLEDLREQRSLDEAHGMKQYRAAAAQGETPRHIQSGDPTPATAGPDPSSGPLPDPY